MGGCTYGDVAASTAMDMGVKEHAGEVVVSRIDLVLFQLGGHGIGGVSSSGVLCAGGGSLSGGGDHPAGLTGGD